MLDFSRLCGTTNCLSKDALLEILSLISFVLVKPMTKGHFLMQTRDTVFRGHRPSGHETLTHGFLSI